MSRLLFRPMLVWGVAVAATFCLTGCKLWTVRPLEDAKSADTAALGPVAYVDSIWSAKLLPAIENNAADARTLLDAFVRSSEAAHAKYCHQTANGPCYLIVKGEGRVIGVDKRSRTGSIAVDIPPLDGEADVTIQVGPILRGVSLRDSTGIVQFTNFANQLQFADVGNELNARILKNVLSPLDTADWKGRNVEFAGTASLGEGPGTVVQELVPVRLALKEAR